MTETAIVFDSGALDRVLGTPELRLMLRDLVAAGWLPVVPAVVLAEAITGRPQDAPANQLVRRLGTVATDEATARLAGRLRHTVIAGGARRTPGGIDAIVAAHATEADRSVVLTTDPGDLRRLLADHPSVVVERA